MMMSASAVSAMIRAKKKKMEEDRDLVKLSGIPEDATDLEVIKNKEYGEMLSENVPKEREELPTIESEMAQEKEAQPHEEMPPNPMPNEMDEDKKAKQARIKGLFMKMGR